MITSRPFFSNRPASLVIQNGACEPAMALQPMVSFSSGAEAARPCVATPLMNTIIATTIDTTVFKFRIKLNRYSSRFDRYRSAQPIR